MSNTNTAEILTSVLIPEPVKAKGKDKADKPMTVNQQYEVWGKMSYDKQRVMDDVTLNNMFKALVAAVHGFMVTPPKFVADYRTKYGWFRPAELLSACSQDRECALYGYPSNGTPTDIIIATAIQLQRDLLYRDDASSFDPKNADRYSAELVKRLDLMGLKADGGKTSGKGLTFTLAKDGKLDGFIKDYADKLKLVWSGKTVDEPADDESSVSIKWDTLLCECPNPRKIKQMATDRFEVRCPKCSQLFRTLKEHKENAQGTQPVGSKADKPKNNSPADVNSQQHRVPENVNGI